MADVSQLLPRGDDHDRGQLFLVGALALAVTFVVLALVMNGVIYTENVSARDLATSTAPAIEYENEAKSVAAHLVTTERGDDYSQLEANVAGGLSAWSNTTQPFGAVEGRIAGVEDTTGSNGTALAQDNSTRNFTSGDETVSWTLATDVKTRDAWINATPEVTEDDIDGEDYQDLTADDGPFHLNITDGGGQVVTLFVYENGGDACVAVFDDETYENSSCTPGTDTVYVDLVSGTYGESPDDQSEEHEWLQVLERAGPDHTLEFGNADEVTGTYQFVVDAEYDDVEANFGSDPDAEPYAEKVLYVVEFQVRYRTQNVRYETTVCVAPGEPSYE
ncbi:hypothetical protein AArcSl_0302 [Halalkaliarchaeum desulfuricum]|uniref:Uncharacterized protein n=1 Tax=Halalkaliarchaeum desulfuricum TaxID=2055893 RepID=A0A343TFT5_9EURY|nr:hypothetical protein [Halalkaliarchaeum desulfuricum]AUX07957.1 hypothetical protein AArcSl_0302 [Halalkaliarchaeum desulfuricum]